MAAGSGIAVLLDLLVGFVDTLLAFFLGQAHDLAIGTHVTHVSTTV